MRYRQYDSSNHGTILLLKCRECDIKDTRLSQFSSECIHECHKSCVFRRSHVLWRRNSTGQTQRCLASTHKTRNSDLYNYKLKFTKQDYLKNSYFIGVITQWNKLLKDCKSSLSLTFFNYNLHIFYTKKNLEIEHVLPDGTQ